MLIPTRVAASVPGFYGDSSSKPFSRNHPSFAIFHFLQSHSKGSNLIFNHPLSQSKNYPSSKYTKRYKSFCIILSFRYCLRGWCSRRLNRKNVVSRPLCISLMYFLRIHFLDGPLCICQSVSAPFRHDTTNHIGPCYMNVRL